MGSDGVDFEQAVRKLAREFEKRQMRKHLAALRDFYARVLLPERKAGCDSWPVSFVLEWLANFQIPPMEKRSPVLPRGSGCPHCPGARATSKGPDEVDRTRLVFPGGHVVKCGRCGGQWVVLEKQSEG